MGRQPSLRWGILGPGHIAGVFASDLLAHGHRLTAVGSRDLRRAESFAGHHGIVRSHGTYESLVDDDEVDVVYVATPHSHHVEHAVAALEHGKHVLVEKAFTTNAREARRIADAARRTGGVAMEAMWTRFLPHMAYVREAIASGALGEVRSLHAEHAKRLPSAPEHRINNPNLSGGSLLDLGVYAVSLAHDLFGTPTDLLATAVLGPTGVDSSVSGTLRHRAGRLSTFYVSTQTRGRNGASVLGTEGRLELAPIWYAQTAVELIDRDDRVVDRFERPTAGRGLQHQAAELERVVAAGASASALMTLEDSIAVMETLDAIRDQIGVRYVSDDLPAHDESGR